MSEDRLPEENTLLDSILEGIEAGKGEETVVIDLREVNGAVSDFFVICQGNSTTQTSAIARKVQEQTKKDLAELPWKAEGETSATWILLDYFNIVVHIFTKEMRGFYDIEDLWADGEIKHLDEPDNTQSGT